MFDQTKTLVESLSFDLIIVLYPDLETEDEEGWLKFVNS
jgi:hypothetical protein